MWGARSAQTCIVEPLNAVVWKCEVGAPVVGVSISNVSKVRPSSVARIEMSAREAMNTGVPPSSGAVPASTSCCARKPVCVPVR